MTIITRQSSPKTGTECPGDCNSNSNSNSSSSSSTTDNNNATNSTTEEKSDSQSTSNSSLGTSANSTKTKMIKLSSKTKKCKNNNSSTQVQKKIIPGGLKNFGPQKASVMCEMTNLTPANKSAAEPDDNVITLDDSTDSGDMINLLPVPSEEGDEAKNKTKKISKVKLKNGNAVQKEDLVACRKSKRLLNKHRHAKKFGGVKNDLGRTVELINPREQISSKSDDLTKALFFNCLNLNPNFLILTPKDPVGSLKRLCAYEVVRQRQAQLDNNKGLAFSADNSSSTNEEDSNTIEDMEIEEADAEIRTVETVEGPPKQSGSGTNNPPGEGDGEFSSWTEHMTSQENSATPPESEKLESYLDCVKKILRIGSSITLICPPGPIDAETTAMQNLINEMNKIKKRQKELEKGDDDGPWYNWNAYVQYGILQQTSPPLVPIHVNRNKKSAQAQSTKSFEASPVTISDGTLDGGKRSVPIAGPSGPSSTMRMI